MDERKRKRMESNRESAKRSRVRKQQQMQQVISEIEHFKKQNSEIASKVDETREMRFSVGKEIDRLAVQKAELEQWLDQLLTIIEKSEKANKKKVVDTAESGALNVDRLFVELPDFRTKHWFDSARNEAEINSGGSESWMEEGLGFECDGLMSPWQASCSKSVNLCH